MPREQRYPEIVTDLRARIRAGEYRQPDGRQKLPSIEQLKEQYGVSYGPIRTAMLMLKAEGLLTGEPGRGVYVAGTPEPPADHPTRKE